MGVPHLKSNLDPYAQHKTIKNRRFVIDGPALAYHILHLCIRTTSNSPYDQPSYQTLGDTAIRWLDRLCTDGNVVSAIFFDGFLPESKKEERLKRTLQATRKLVEYATTFPKDVPQARRSKDNDPGLSGEVVLFPVSWPSESRRKLPVPAFAVPAVLEALRRSESYGPLVKVMPGEADVYCAKHSNSNGTTVLTSDSDLLVYNLGEKGSVVFIRELEAGSDTNGNLRAPEFRGFDICERLLIDPTYGPIWLAAELTMDPHRGLTQILEQVRQQAGSETDSEEFRNLAALYSLSDVSLKGDDIYPLDPRISEIALGWRNAAGNRQTTAYRAPGDGLIMYLPSLLESPFYASAWEPSKPVRILAYSLLQLAADRPVPSAVECRRLQNYSRGTPIDLYPVPELDSHAASLNTTLSQITAHMGQHNSLKEFWPLALAISLEILTSEDKGRGLPLSVDLLRREAIGSLDETHWDFVHFGAQVEATFYSLRMLHQLLEYTSRLTGDTPAYLRGLQAHLRTLPPISRSLGLRGLRPRLAQVREAGSWHFLAGVSKMSETTASRLASLNDPVETAKKRKRNKSERSPATRRPVGGKGNPFELLGSE